MLLKLAITALFAALVSVGTFIAIPVGPIPIVLQNFFALLSGLVLGPLMGATAVGLFLLAGTLGFPVFAGGTGGIAHFAGPTGGYLIGYLLAAVTAGLIAGKPRPNVKTPVYKIILAVIAGFLVVYIPGILWLKIRWDLSWGKAFLSGFVPFIAGDILKGIAAVLISGRLRRVTADLLHGK